MANLYSRLIFFKCCSALVSLVWELAAVLARCLTKFHISKGQDKGSLPLVCPSCTTCSVCSHGLILVFFVKIKTNSRTGCPFVLRGIGL